MTGAETAGTADATACALIAESIAVRRGDLVVVSGFTRTFECGRVAWLVGPNGAGKSSLLRVLAGLETPAAGRVVRLSRGGVRGAIGYYHPAMSLPPEAAASAFMGLAQRLVSGVQPLRPERELAGKRCGSLSTGEQKRLLVGAILAGDAEFLLLDEPYEHLSESGRAELTAILDRLAERRVVVVSTNQDLPAGATGPIVSLPLAAEVRT